MRVTFLGTGTSTGVPVIGCECKTCRSTDARDRRWRPSIYLQLDDGLSVLVDASPDLRAQALRFDVPRVDLILLTHSHADHVLGLDDVRIYNMRQGGLIPCYGDTRTITDVRRMFAYVFDPKTPRGGGLPQLTLWPIAGPFSVEHCTVIPIPLRRFLVTGWVHLHISPIAVRFQTCRGLFSATLTCWFLTPLGIVRTRLISILRALLRRRSALVPSVRTLPI